MNLTKLEAKRAKLNEQIRKAEQRQLEQKQRNLLKLARKYGLLDMDQAELETALTKIAVATESETASDTAAPGLVTRTPARDQPETARDTPKKMWGMP
jgi:hypothetical protein